MAKRKILVTRKWPEAVEDRLAANYDATLNESDTPMTTEEIGAALAEYDAVCPTVSDKLPASILTGGHRTQILGNYGVGFNHIDIDAAKNAGLVVTNTPDCLTDCTADLALTLMLMVARRTGEGERELRAGKWTGWRPTHMMGTKLRGKTLGVLGMGRIGSAAAARARHGLGMNIVYYNLDEVPAQALEGLDAQRLDTIEAVMEAADVVTLHMPGGGANTRVIDADKLERLGPDGILVNTARGDVVDQDALIAALTGRRIAGAGLDVYEGEPEVPDALIALENVVLLPHLGSATEETRVAMGMMVADNLDAFFAGQTPPNRVA